VGGIKKKKHMVDQKDIIRLLFELGSELQCERRENRDYFYILLLSTK